MLYSGALALNSLFHIGESLGLTQGAAIWLLVILLGLAGILYAVIGGMRAMAIADSINGIGLVIGGLMVPIFGLMAMGKGVFTGYRAADDGTRGEAELYWRQQRPYRLARRLPA